MVLSVHASVSLPTVNVGVHINLSDKQVKFIIRSSLLQQVLPLSSRLGFLSKLFSLSFGLFLALRHLLRRSHGLLQQVDNMRVERLNNFVVFHFSCVECLRLLVVVVGRLDSMETLNVMLSHRTLFVKLLYKSNHRLITL